MNRWRDIWVAPSDFVYLLQDCPRCWWLKVVARIKRPGEALPEIFNKIDNQFKAALSEEGALEHLLGRPARVVSADESVKSRRLEFPDLRVKVTVGGFMDHRIQFLDADEEYGVYDEKTTVPSDYKRRLFEHQLNAYAYALLNPAKGDPVNVTSLGLFVCEPEAMTIVGSRFVHQGAITLLPIELEQGIFAEQLRALAELAAQDRPPKQSERCRYCANVSEVLSFSRRLKEEDAEAKEEVVV